MNVIVKGGELNHRRRHSSGRTRASWLTFKDSCEICGDQTNHVYPCHCEECVYK